MYQVSPEGLCMINYYSGVKGFINYALSNLKNISRGNARYPCKRYNNKKFLDPAISTMHLLQKKAYEKIVVLVCTWRTYVPYDTMVERIVSSTSSSSNVHEVVDDGCNENESWLYK